MSAPRHLPLPSAKNFLFSPDAFTKASGSDFNPKKVFLADFLSGYAMFNSRLEHSLGVSVAIFFRHKNRSYQRSGAACDRSTGLRTASNLPHHPLAICTQRDTASSSSSGQSQALALIRLAVFRGEPQWCESCEADNVWILQMISVLATDSSLPNCVGNQPASRGECSPVDTSQNSLGKTQ